MLNLALLLAAAGGGLVGAWKISGENTARELLSEAMRIQGLLEAFILDGKDYEKKTFSENRDLQTDDSDTKDLFLRKVEVRQVLDEAIWNSPKSKEGKHYNLNGHRRAWIVRDKIARDKDDLPVLYGMGARPGNYHPALLTSKAFEELWAWIEQVACARYGWWIFKNLSDDGYYILKPLLGALAEKDRIGVIDETHPLSNRAKKLLGEYKKFLNDYKKK